MFRCITELKGIAVDIDSIPNIDTDFWLEINGLMPCVFLTGSEEREKSLARLFGDEKVLRLKSFERFLAPSKRTHINVLKALGIKNTELAYLSCNHSFLENANSFLCGTIWITDKVSYQQASKAPDMIRKNMDAFKEALKNHMVGFFGEMVLNPLYDAPATMLPVDFETDDEEIPMYVLGRYFGYSHYMNQLHPYSSAIYLNKIQGRSYTGVYDSTFQRIYAAALRTLKGLHNIDSICAVPVKPTKPARFDKIVTSLAELCELENMENQFTCIKDYPDQKSLSREEREHNIKGAFQFSGDLSGRTIALIDDIVSTGSTVKECVRELKAHGAKEVILVVLAINQYDTGSYWSSDSPQVTCPTCGAKMKLLLNRSGVFFYNCLNCYDNGNNTTMGFSKGWQQICDKENQKFDLIIPSRRLNNTEIEANNNRAVHEKSLKCPYCSAINSIDIEDISSISSYERDMGEEILYEFDTDDVSCQHCKRLFRVHGYISEYPQGNQVIENINVERIEVSM